MTNQYGSPTQTQGLTLASFMNWVYLWMGLGLGLSALVAYMIDTTPALQSMIARNSGMMFVVIIAQLVCVFAFNAVLRRFSTKALAGLFLFYCALTGVTFSVILMVYTQNSITQAFMTTAGSFVVLSMYGFTTKRDLSPMRTFLMIGLFGIIIASVLALFMTSMQGYVAQMVISTIGVIIFAGLMAYDTQKIKQSYQAIDKVPFQKLALQGALSLYLDFINMFIFLLRIFGSRR